MSEAASKKVLIVEDDADAAQALRIVLESDGYAVLHAPNAEEGLRRVHTERPDIILLDIMMPSGTEGFHFVWTLRKDDDANLSKIPIIVLTAIHGTTRLRFYPEQSDKEYAPFEFLPVQSFLDKPAPSREVLATVKRVLAEANAPAAAGEPESSA